MNKDNNEDLNENKGKKFKMLFGIIFLVLLAIIFFFVIHQSAKRYNGTDSAYSDLFKKYEFKKMPNFIQPRDNTASATKLNDGRILFTGGIIGKQCTSSTELYLPEKNKFIKTANMNIPRCWHSSILLKNGNVLVTGGHTDEVISSLKSAEIYDLKTGEFIQIDDMKEGMSHHKMFLLKNGDVLIVQNPEKIELFDSKKYLFKKLSGIQIDKEYSKYSYKFLQLSDEKVLMYPNDFVPLKTPVVIINLDNLSINKLSINLFDIPNHNYDIAKISKNEILVTGAHYNPSDTKIINLDTNNERIIKKSFPSRYSHISILLDDANVLIIGGESGVAYTLKSLSSTELYISKENKFIKFKNMHYKRGRSSFIRLNDTDYIIWGGHNSHYGIYPPEILHIKSK